MKLIIAGGRNFKDYDLVKRTMKSVKGEITEIVSGNASGADTLGEKYAREKGIDLIIMPANWTKHGKAGGPIRNERMAKYADALIVFWDGQSRGTKSMIDLGEKYNLKTHVVKYES